MIHWQNLRGAAAHRWQRYSALYLAVYTPLLAIYVAQLPEQNSLQNLIGNLFHYCIFGYLSVIAYAFLLVHLWVGGRDILIDYLPRPHLNLGLNLYLLSLFAISLNLGWLIIDLYPY
ncbi:MAG: succinate dehydrogenase, hydrophobic membrane anchor protein [Thiotrichales bacterium]|nr:succinate dehydrogenase, hydrophobic membrane anchor protein [Thiotrichales bacterium]